MLVHPDYPDGNGTCAGILYPQKEVGLQYIRSNAFAFLVGVCINVSQEMGGNPRIDELGIAQDNGAWKVKRFVWEPEQQHYGVL